MLLDMSEHGRKGFETIGEAAARLLQGMVQRAKNRPAVETTAPIQQSGEMSSVAGKAPGCDEGLTHPGAAIVASLGGATGDGAVKLASNDNAGRVTRKVPPAVPGDASMRRPASNADSYTDAFTVLRGNVRWGE